MFGLKIIKSEQNDKEEKDSDFLPAAYISNIQYFRLLFVKCPHDSYICGEHLNSIHQYLNLSYHVRSI